MVLCLQRKRTYPVIDRKEKRREWFVLNFNDQAFVDNVKNIRALRAEMFHLDVRMRFKKI